MASSIHSSNLGYTIYRNYANFCIGSAYSFIQVAGKERIPKDGSVIFTPNHCNTLLDALVVLRAVNGPVVFGARADLFKKPVLGKVMRWLKILPMPRVRDGIREVANNVKTNEEVVSALLDGVPFCIFPEGTHRPMHSLMPMRKGFIRIARAAIDKGVKKMYVVPVGLEYGDYFRYKASQLVTFGEPICVNDYLEAHKDSTDADICRGLEKMVHDSISQLITYLPDDEHYEGKWTMVKALTAPFSGTPKVRRAKNAVAVEKVEALWADPAFDVAAAEQKAAELEAARKAAGISFMSFGHKCVGTSAVLKTLGLLATLPLYIVSAVLSLPNWVATSLMVKKIKDRAFRNSVKVGIYNVIMPLLLIIWLIASLCCHLAWYWVLAGAVMCVLGYPFLCRYTNWLRIYVSDIKLLANKKLREQFTAFRNLAQ